MNTLRTFGNAAGTAAVVGGLVLIATPATAADSATVSILHGVPNIPVDVYAKASG